MRSWYSELRIKICRSNLYDGMCDCALSYLEVTSLSKKLAADLRPKLCQSVSSAKVWFQKEFVMIRAHSSPLSWEELFLIPSQLLIIAGHDWEYPHFKGNPRVCQWILTMKIQLLHAFVFCPLFTKCLRVQQRLQLCNSLWFHNEAQFALSMGGGRGLRQVAGF